MVAAGIVHGEHSFISARPVRLQTPRQRRISGRGGGGGGVVSRDSDVINEILRLYAFS